MIYILWFETTDHSQIELLRAYKNRLRAQEDLELVQYDSSRIYHVIELPFAKFRESKKAKATQHV